MQKNSALRMLKGTQIGGFFKKVKDRIHAIPKLLIIQKAEGVSARVMMLDKSIVARLIVDCMIAADVMYHREHGVLSRVLCLVMSESSSWHEQ